MYRCFALHVCLHTSFVPGACGGQKKVAGSLELESLTLVSRQSRCWESNSGRAASALNHGAITPAPSACLLGPTHLFLGRLNRVLSSPQEENSLFIMTNMIITVNQTQSTCPEVGGSLGKPLGAPHRRLLVAKCVQATRNLSVSIPFPDS